jgi:acyl dehydratase
VQVISDIGGFVAAKGQQLGVSEWLTIDQQRIDLFAAATGDDYWIHVDPGQAEGGPYGATIAHGFLTLSLIPVLERQNFTVSGDAINYGVDRVRFISPVKVGSRVRAVTEVLEVAEIPGSAQVTYLTTVEHEGSERPACAADHIGRYSFAAEDGVSA